MSRTLVISNSQLYGEGYYGEGYYGGFEAVTISNNWKFRKSINSQKEFTFTIIDNPNNLTIEKGLEIHFLDSNNNKIYSGIILNVQPYEINKGELYYDIECTNYSLLANKRFLNASFTNKTCGYILRYMINNVLYQENITIGKIDDGIELDKVIFNLKSCYDVGNYMKDKNPGYNWHIDDNRKYYFIKKSTYQSIYTIDNSFQHINFKPKYNNSEYRNTQYIIGGYREITEKTGYVPTPKPDGESRIFTVSHGIAREPTIYINSVAVDSDYVGTNYDTGMKWTWSYNSKQIIHDEGESVLTDSDAIEIDFIPLEKVYLKYVDETKVQTRKNIEGGSGIYENVYENSDILTNVAAVNTAKGLIERYANVLTIDINIEEDLKDIDINKLVRIEKPLFGINDWFLVEEINASYQNPNYITYQIKFTANEYDGSWEDYFKSLLSIDPSINENDIFTQFKAINESWYWGGLYNIDKVTCLAPSLTLAPSLSLAPGSNLVNTLIYD